MSQKPTPEQKAYIQELEAARTRSKNGSDLERNMWVWKDRYGDTMPPEREPGYVPRAMLSVQAALQQLKRLLASILVSRKKARRR